MHACSSWERERERARARERERERERERVGVCVCEKECVFVCARACASVCVRSWTCWQYRTTHRKGGVSGSGFRVEGFGKAMPIMDSHYDKIAYEIAFQLQTLTRRLILQTHTFTHTAPQHGRPPTSHLSESLPLLLLLELLEDDESRLLRLQRSVRHGAAQRQRRHCGSGVRV